MDKQLTKSEELAKALVVEKFNEAVNDNSKADENTTYLAKLVANNASEELLLFATGAKERLEASKAALAKQKLDAEANYDKAIAVAEAARAELER